MLTDEKNKQRKEKYKFRKYENNLSKFKWANFLQTTREFLNFPLNPCHQVKRWQRKEEEYITQNSDSDLS